MMSIRTKTSIETRANLGPEELAAGSDDPHRQAEVILEDSDTRVAVPERAKSTDSSDPGSSRPGTGVGGPVGGLTPRRCARRGCPRNPGPVAGCRAPAGLQGRRWPRLPEWQIRRPSRYCGISWKASLSTLPLLAGQRR